MMRRPPRSPLFLYAPLFRSVLAVEVEEDDVRILEPVDLLKDRRGRARLPRAGRAEDRDVFGEQLVRVEVEALVLHLGDGAEGEIMLAECREDRGNILGARREDGAPEFGKRHGA